MKKIIFTLSIVGSLALLLLASFAGFAQEEATDNGSETMDSSDQLKKAALDIVESNEGLDSESVLANCTTDPCVFLPAIKAAPKFYDTQVIHKSNCSSDFTRTFYGDSDTINLPMGVREFSIGGFAAGYNGSRYETYFVINGQERRDIATFGTITSNDFAIGSRSLLWGPPGTSSCASEFPAGRTYQVHFLIDGQLVKILTLNIN